MKILTTVKRVVDPDAKVRLRPDGSEIVTEGLEAKMNSFDEIGVEEAIRLKEKHSGEVVVVSIGDSAATKEIRTALAMGGDRGVLVKAEMSELDPQIVANLLAAVIEREEPDVVMMGKLSVDAENNQVVQRVAANLGWPQATFAFDCSIEDGWATVGREVDGGTATVRVQCPCVISADLRLNEPRYASLPGIMKAKRKPIQELTPDELGVEMKPQLKIMGYSLPPARAAGEILEDVDQLMDRLVNVAKVF